MALHMVSLFALVLFALLDAFFSVGLYDSLRYLAGRNGGECGWIDGMQGLARVLPWVFLALGAAAVAQLIFRGRFLLSVMFFAAHMAHMALRLCLVVLGSSYCTAPSILPTVGMPIAAMLFMLFFAVLPLPLLLLQLRAMRNGKVAGVDRL